MEPEMPERGMGPRVVGSEQLEDNRDMRDPAELAERLFHKRRLAPAPYAFSEVCDEIDEEDGVKRL